MSTTNPRKLLHTALLTGFFIFIVVFAFYRSYNLIFGVKIKEVNLQNGSMTAASIQSVTGNAKNAVVLKLNGREISIDKSGNFSENLVLSPGYNIVSIEAQDKFGSIDHKDYQLIYKQK